MTIFEFADIIDKQLIITRFPNQDGRWCALFEGAEVKGDGVLEGTFGDGKTPFLALSQYVARIRGKVLVFNAMRDDRREYTVPKTVIAVIDNEPAKYH